LKLWPFELRAANEYARLYAEMRNNGDHVGAVDLMIASVSRVLPDCVIVTDDTDFSRIPGIKVVDWTEK
jgi:tRNA(fMet)-specific endonuclease VapC